MNGSPGSFELLSTRVDELEKRVHSLECLNEANVPEAISIVAPTSAGSFDGVELLQTSSLFPILGRGLIGIAGAYVLRAVATTGLMPQVAVAAVAVIYAFAWLVWSARVSKVSDFAPLV